MIYPGTRDYCPGQVTLLRDMCHVTGGKCRKSPLSIKFIINLRHSLIHARYDMAAAKKETKRKSRRKARTEGLYSTV